MIIDTSKIIYLIFTSEQCYFLTCIKKLPVSKSNCHKDNKRLFIDIRLAVSTRLLRTFAWMLLLQMRPWQKGSVSEYKEVGRYMKRVFYLM